MTHANLEDQLLSLPESDRIHMLEILWDSLLPGEATDRIQKWCAESERRLDGAESGQLPLVDGEEVFREIRESIGG